MRLVLALFNARVSWCESIFGECGNGLVAYKSHSNVKVALGGCALFISRHAACSLTHVHLPQLDLLPFRVCKRDSHTHLTSLGGRQRGDPKVAAQQLPAPVERISIRPPVRNLLLVECSQNTNNEGFKINRN
jgi:hypothetical protein